MTAPTKAQVAEAAAVLRTLLAKAEVGEVEVSGRRDKAVLARVESAVLGLDVAAGTG
ncbi:MAG: hypothetical protein KY440_03490 [Actinobacteria bacterium]|nr:hypothetical protein [Actinomycetota bacterium]